MQSLTVNCFGVGDGAACADRNHSSYLYTFGDCSLLLDCGDSVSRGYKASGLSYEQVDRIILSHLHLDHVGGLFMLLQGFWLEGRRKPLPIHLPVAGIGPIKAMLEAGYLYDELLDFDLSFAALEEATSFEVKGVRVRAFLTTHLDRFRGKFQQRYGTDFHSYSFLLEGDGIRVVHSADLGAPADLDPLLGQPLDLLVCELAHFTPVELFSYLQGREIKRVAFVHVGRAYWAKLEETKALAARMLPGMELLFPQDQDVIRVQL